MNRPRAVIDTNVWVSAYYSPDGVSAQAIALWRKGAAELCLSPDILREYRRTFARHFGGDAAMMRLIESDREKMLNPANIHPHPPLLPGCVPGDADDEKFVECAVALGARYLVSGDRQVLAVGEFRGVTVLSPSAVARLFAGINL